MPSISELKIKLFADTADLASIEKWGRHAAIQGITTNPTLMRKAGVPNYEQFCRAALALVPHLPVSLEVFSDDVDEMEAQARIIASWGSNTYVKIPVTNTQSESTLPIIHSLSHAGIRLNITGVMTHKQVEGICSALSKETPSIVSVFAGRIADTGVDPIPVMKACVETLRPLPNSELLWASPRELLNLFQADEIGVHIITATTDILNKIHLIGKNLTAYSLETVKMFFDDATAAGYSL